MKHIWIVGFVLFLGILTKVSGHSRASYNETCGDGIRCDSRKSLSCTENVCACVKPDEMMYETTKDKCVVLVGERCSYTAVEIMTDSTQEKRYTERLDCVSNATCSSEGYCECKSDSFEDVGGVCTPKGLHGVKCSKDDECRDDFHLTCDGGRCSCNKSESIYDPTYQQCVGLSGAPCRKYNRCVQNAVCNNRYYNNNEKCTCSGSYQTSRNGFCLSKYGMSCDASLSPCSEKFACIEGKCGCHFKDHQTYIGNILQCRSYVGGPCLETVKGEIQEFQCGPNASCKNSTGIYQCECDKGYIESVGRECKLTFSSSCSSITSCDSTANLECREGKCLCARSFQQYDFNTNKCIGLVGATCGDQIGTCIEGASCIPFRDSQDSQYGICRCNANFITNTERKCFAIKSSKQSVEEGTSTESE